MSVKLYHSPNGDIALSLPHGGVISRLSIPIKQSGKVKYINVYSTASCQPVQVTCKAEVFEMKVRGKRQVCKGACSIYSGCSCRVFYVSIICDNVYCVSNVSFPLIIGIETY